MLDLVNDRPLMIIVFLVTHKLYSGIRFSATAPTFGEPG